jgi:hypothetical protein
VSNATQVRCTSCKYTGSERVDSDPSVSLSLLESVEHATSKGSTAPASSRLSLPTLVQHHWQQTETLADFKCERCKKIGTCVKCCTLKFAPVVLVLHIKRFAWVPKRGALFQFWCRFYCDSAANTLQNRLCQNSGSVCFPRGQLGIWG